VSQIGEAEVIEVVVFTGGRGSAVLSHRLMANPDVHVTLAVNGYDDGASTGEVRRFLGDALGPSDFRKNASRAAAATNTCSSNLVQLLDARIPEQVAADTVGCLLDALSHGRPVDPSGGSTPLKLPDAEKNAVADRMQTFLEAWRTSDRSFRFSDCAIGNLVFAGSYLRCGRRFNAAVDDYCALVGLPAGLIENVSDGSNAFLVGLDVTGQVLGTEEAIVDSRHANRIADIFLIDRPLPASESMSLSAAGETAARAFFASHGATLALNPRLATRLDRADVILYAPGTQHSSLFPSYLTPNLCDHIARNFHAVKLLVTNLQYDAEIAGTSAVSLVRRALFYLTNKGQHQLPAPCLITHYLLNDPQHAEEQAPYVPLGQVESFEDPRLVRIGYYEDGVTGRHDGSKVIEPFIESLLAQPARLHVTVLLYGTRSVNKLAQTLLEIARGLTTSPRCDLHVHVPIAVGFDEAFVSQLPFEVSLYESDSAAADALRDRVASSPGGYVALFESSGMYRGEDLVALTRYLEADRLDAVWGSRRLSVRDIDESFRLYDDRGRLLRAVSRIGSHLLSLAYLLLYGRYVSDTLSGSRIVRAADAGAVPVAFTHPLANQYVLSELLRRRADLLEVPVQFLSLSPERVRRTGIGEGLRSLAAIVRLRFA
jgi:2-phospho-L-lactate transferase/gluconeogenesis factor (CofD/UPF0052 family)